MTFLDRMNFIRRGLFYTRSTLIFFMICVNSGQAQINATDNPNKENGRVLEQNEQVSITIDDAGKLNIESRISEVVEYHTESAKLFGEQIVSYPAAFAQINDLTAYTSVPLEKNKFKKIEVTDFKKSDNRSEGVFYDDQKKISFIFPALQAGATTHYSYTKKYLEPRLWGYFLFSSMFPTQKSVYTISAPETVKINYKLFGNEKQPISFSQERKGKNIIYTWQATDVDKISLSAGADGIWHSQPHLIVFVESYVYNGESQFVLRNVDDLYAWYRGFTTDLDEANNTTIQNMVASIVDGKSTEIEKVEAIYYWVQQNIKYIAIEDGLGGFKPRTASTVLSRRYGDCKDMSNLLHNMLNVANIKSGLTWIGTTRIPYTYEQVPTPMSSNHMICTYKNDGNYYFLDATDQYNKLGIPTTHIQGREALIDKGNDKYEIVPVPVVSPELNQTIDTTTIHLKENKVAGTGKTIFKGYNRLSVTSNLENLGATDKQNFLTALMRKGNNKFTLTSAQTEHLADKNEDLTIDYSFEINNYFVQNQKEILFNPHINKALINSIIDPLVTKSSVYYPYKNITSNVLRVKIPDGFSLTYVPKSVSYGTESFGYSLNYLIDSEGLVVEQKIIIDALQITPEQFEDWNRMVKSLFSAYKESVVFQNNQ